MTILGSAKLARYVFLHGNIICTALVPEYLGVAIIAFVNILMFDMGENRRSNPGFFKAPSLIVKYDIADFGEPVGCH